MTARTWLLATIAVAAGIALAISAAYLADTITGPPPTSHTPTDHRVIP